MWLENDIVHDDMETITSDENIDWEILQNKNILVTGGTGLIGYYLIAALSYKMITSNIKFNIYALVRNIEKAKEKFAAILSTVGHQHLNFIEGDLLHIPSININVDYIIHGAAPTASSFFSNQPVETAKEIVLGTDALLNLAKKHKSKMFLYLSSMEVYGTYPEESLISENAPAYVDTAVPRNSYPEAKRMAEMLGSAYHSEYGVPFYSLRLAQTFGPGVSKDDQRVFAYFLRCLLEQNNIVLKTKGETKRMYLYLTDAVRAILTILTKANAVGNYNVANPATYCSIVEMAETVANIGNGNISVEFALEPTAAEIYLPTLKYNLDISKLTALGWKAQVSLEEAFVRLAKSIS